MDPATDFNISFSSSAAKSLKVTWKIPEYFSLPMTPDYSLDSPSFNFVSATWCLRLDPNNISGTYITLVRLNSLVPENKVICKYDIVLENGECYSVYDFYFPFHFYENYEQSSTVPAIPKRITLVVDQEKFVPGGSLVVLCHLFSTTEDDEIVQKYKIDSSKLYDAQKNSSVISLKSSIAQSLKIEWKIPRYFSLPETVGYSLCSPSFDFGYATWFLKLYPNGTEDDPNTIISLVKLHSLTRSREEIIYSFDVIVENKRFYNTVYSEFSFSENNEHKDSICVPENCRRIAPDDNITLSCHFFFEEPTGQNSVVQKMAHELDSYKTLCLDLKNLLLNGSDHDLTLKVKEKEFKVHRNILSARSQVFESMLTHDMSEKNSGIVDIPDCDPQAMEQFLLYVYCGRVESLNETNMLGLYYAADKYGMILLREECREFIRNSLSCDSICDVLQLALNHSDEGLIECATEFFVNNTNGILNTKEWVSFMKGKEIFVNELLMKATRKLSDENKMLKMEKQYW